MRRWSGLVVLLLLVGCPTPPTSEPEVATKVGPEAAPVAAEEAEASYTLRLAWRFDGRGGETTRAVSWTRGDGGVRGVVEGGEVRVGADGVEGPAWARAWLGSVLEGSGRGARVERALPGGGVAWIDPVEGWEEGRAEFGGEEVATRTGGALVEGVLASGVGFAGRLETELALEGEVLVAVRAREELRCADGRSIYMELALEPEEDRRVGWWTPRRAQVGVGGLSLGCVVLLALSGYRLRGRRGALSMVLALSLGAAPAVSLAQQEPERPWFDVTGDELGWSTVAVLVGGAAAVTATVLSAPVWVPWAIGAATVVGIGSYFALREPPIRAGEVVERVYEPAEWKWMYLPTTKTTFVNGEVKTVTAMEWRWVYDDEDHWITIRDGERERVLRLSAERFAGVAVGDRYDMDVDGGVVAEDNRAGEPPEGEAPPAEAPERGGITDAVWASTGDG